MSAGGARRRFLCPETLQASAMDCGPAAIGSILEGFGIRRSFESLREACGTSVDGTSIDTLEDVALAAGLDAEQIMLAPRSLLEPSAGALPALIVTKTPHGDLHFVVVWRKLGPWLLVMNPASGRRWVRATRFLEEVYLHDAIVPVGDWRAWCESPDALDVWRSRSRAVGISRDATSRALAGCRSDPGPTPFAAFDAALCTVESCRFDGGLRRRDATRLFEKLLVRARQARERGKPPPTLPGSAEVLQDAAGRPRGVRLTGVVLLRFRGTRGSAASHEDGEFDRGSGPAASAPTPDTKAGKPGPMKDRLRALGPAALIAAFGWSLAAAALLWFQALLFQGLVRAGELAARGSSWLWGLFGLALFLAAGAWFEYRGFHVRLALGRVAEGRDRIRLADRLARLEDRYFRTRLLSDVVERMHAIRAVRTLPTAVTGVVRSAVMLAATAVGIRMIDPTTGFPVAVAVVASLAMPFLFMPRYEELDLRCRSFGAAVGGHYLDALRGVWALRAHRAGSALRREQQATLVEWSDARLERARHEILLDGALCAVGFGSAFWILGRHLGNAGIAGGSLLAVYWTLRLPEYAADFSAALQRLPKLRNVLVRADELLDAVEDTRPADVPPGTSGPRLTFESVAAQVDGADVLRRASFEIASGEHVAVVGPSGAGKSSLVGLILGWIEPSGGRIRIDGRELDRSELLALRERTVWVSPEVHLWNRSLDANLTFGNAAPDGAELERILDAAELWPVVTQLPRGARSKLGEGGARLSGGEGQRVRIGRALGSKRAELVVLDEPFRGLERARRGRLLDRLRLRWPSATLLYVTHDVEHARGFDKVVVLEQGTVKECGPPGRLLASPRSRFKAMLDLETAWLESLRRGRGWRRWRLHRAEIRDLTSRPEGATPEEKAS